MSASTPLTEYTAPHLVMEIEAQKVLMQAIASLKAAGDSLVILREALNAGSEGSPVETDLGWFTSFDDFINKSPELSNRDVQGCIKLAENWDTVLKLGLQDDTQLVTVMSAVPFERTLEIIDEYNNCVAQGADPDSLDLTMFLDDWELEDRLEILKEERYHLEDERSRLKDRLVELEMLNGSVKI